jgi:oligopeptide/dipeptide ABC transporter ATP-binding protein
MSLLEIEDVVVRYPGRDARGRRIHWAAVNGVSFAVGDGERLGLVGESGSGKTTLGKAMLGLEPLASGRVRFRGREVRALRGAALDAFRRGAQMVFQDPLGSLNPRQTVGGAIEEVLAVHRLCERRERPGRAREVLALVGLDAGYAGRYPHEFSGGQRQRIGIARALAMEPALLVADEPVSALDVSVQAQVLNLLRELSEARRMALVLVAHDLAVVHYLCERVVVLYRGRVVEEGPVAKVFGEPAHPYTRLLKAAAPDPDDPPLAAAGMERERAAVPAAGAAGCGFADRCPRASARCRAEVPPLRDLGQGHRVGCHD